MERGWTGMTPDQVRDLIAKTGRDRLAVSKLLGYRSENSLRRCEDGTATLPATKARWLERYAKFRQKQLADEADWIARNPVDKP